ncbi:MAG: TolC family protein [Gammaproteobacteria bacterium]
MRRLFQVSIFVLTSGIASLSAFAATAPDINQPLTLVQLTDIALDNNPQTRIAWATIRESEAGVELARAGYWPLVTASYSYQRNRQVNFTGTSVGAQTRYGPSINLSYLLWDFGNRSGSLDAARFTLTAAELTNSQTMQDVILQVEQGYYQVLGLQALRDADQQNLQDAQTSLDAARQRKQSGLATIGDVYQAEAALAGAQLALQQTEGNLAVARGQLAVATGYSADTKLTLAPWESDVTPQLPAHDISELLKQARQTRPELLASKAREQKAVATLEATRGQGLPSLALNATAGRNTSVLGDTHTSADSYSAGVTLSVPLFAGFADQAAEKQAQAAIDVAQATTLQLQQQVELEVWQAYQNVHTAAATLTTTDAQLKSAQQAADVTAARYKNGLDSILDTLTAQATLANARVQQVQAHLNWFAALAALGHAVGGLGTPASTSESK